MMQATKRLMLGVVLTQIAVAVGCADEAAPESTDAVQSAVLLCDGSNERNREYYADENFTVWRGSETCLCNGDSSRQGVRTLFFLEANYSCFSF